MEGKFRVDEVYEFHRILKQIAYKNEVMILTHFFLDKFCKDYFYKLMNLYDAFMLYDSNVMHYFDSKRFRELEMLFKYMKSAFKDRAVLHEENRKLEFVNELILESSYKQTNDELLDASLKKIAEIIGTDFGFIASYNEKEIVIRTVDGKYNLPDGFLEEVKSFGFMSDEINDAMRKKVFIVTDKDFKNSQQKYISKKYNFKTLLTIPIGVNASVASEMIILFSHKEKEVMQEYVPLLETIGSTLWILIQKQKTHKEYQENIIRTEKLRALGELAGGIAHDFNNLLTTILGFSQISLARELSEDIKRYMEIIHKSALDGKQIVERIQSFNRRKFEDKKDVYSINSIVESGIEMARPRWKNFYESYGNRLKIIKGLHSSSKIYCVEHEIREVIINLLSNAMDAMEEGGVLTIRTDDIEDKVVIEIGDTGTGIAEEIKEKIFAPFYSTKGNKGTGLGLSIVKEIIEDHKGVIELESSIGKGTTFRLFFNRFIEKNKKIEISEPTVNVDLHAIQKQNILVIDDIQQVGETVVQMLQTLGIDAELEIMSENVMSRLLNKKYDIIISDLAMPEINGIDLSKIVKRQYPESKFIIVTGWPGKFRKDGYASVDHILRKPFTIDELVKAINKVI